MCWTVSIRGVARKSPADSLIEQSRFVFKGTVVKLGASNVKQVPQSDKTAVVRVDEVFRSTEATRELRGQEVTAVLNRASGDEAGKSFVFFSNGFVFGDSVAVRVVERRAPSAQAERLLARIPQFERDAAETALAERLNSAEAVVVGRVTSLRALDRGERFRSEHDPDWWVATVEVQSQIRGRKPQRSVEVLFANSRDRAWYDSPKFHAGEGAIVALRKEKVKGVRGEFYVATHPHDLIALDRMEELRQVLKKRGKR
jgi:hypothetical protein